MSDWSKVTREDVIKAIEKFNKEKPNYAKSRTTYLIYDNIVYPGKQIRRMAYDIAFGAEPDHFYGEKTIECDERQHFTKQRKIALLSYPSDLHLYFNKKMWLKACDDINAKMKKKNSPFRDETRAFYDSVRDIEAYRHGYKLIRIMHGQFDFSRADAKECLLELIGD